MLSRCARAAACALIAAVGGIRALHAQETATLDERCTSLATLALPETRISRPVR
jgi:hypothetical protein